jgi:hypothetical protein
MNAMLVRFAQRLGVGPQVAQDLISLSDYAARIQTKWHNGDATGTEADTAIKAVETFAAALHLRVDWPGLYPVFHTPQQDEVHLPD